MSFHGLIAHFFLSFFLENFLCSAFFFFWLLFFLILILIFYLLLFIYFLAVLGLLCCTQAFSSCSEQGLLFVVVHRLLIAVAYLVAEHGL